MLQAFGEESEAGLWALNFVIGKCESNLVLWQSETKVISDTAQTLVDVLNSVERSVIIYIDIFFLDSYVKVQLS